jgi:flagellar biosynthesis protein
MSEQEGPKKRQKVVALKYDAARQAAPRMIAKGQGGIAEKIIATAKEKGIPLYTDPELVEILSQLDVGLEIEPELYQAVAEVLIFIYKTNQKKMKQAGPSNLKPLPNAPLRP